MVLQNKYKARASRRYNAARGGSRDERGRGGARRGREGTRHYTEEAFPSLNGNAEDDADESGSGEDGDNDDGDGKVSQIEKKYAPRTLQSNAWRYTEPETDAKEEEVVEEPEVDLSGLLERVARLDSSRTTKALSSREAAESSIQEEADDIDHTLLHILERQRERERGKASTRENSSNEAAKSNPLTPSELKVLEMEGKRLLEEKDREMKHYGKAQGLKSQQPKTISINIGENQRRKEGQSKENKAGGALRRQLNLAALYGDDDVEFDSPRLVNEDMKPPSSWEKSITAHKDALDSDRSEKGSAPLKEHQDFLDSII